MVNLLELDYGNLSVASDFAKMMVNIFERRCQKYIRDFLPF